jgi:hypothetical protein
MNWDMKDGMGWMHGLYVMVGILSDGLHEIKFNGQIDAMGWMV